MLKESAHLLFLLIACFGVAAACVWAYRRSPTWGVIVGVGANVRLAAGPLLTISYCYTNIKSRTTLNLTRQDLRQAAADLALGLAVTFIPISVLRATSIVDFNGGRGLSRSRTSIRCSWT
jgi:hypothetical protein